VVITIDGGDGTDTLTAYNSDDFGFNASATTPIVIQNVEKISLSTTGTTVKFANSLLSGKTYSVVGSTSTDDIQVKVTSSVSSTDLSGLVNDSNVEKYTVNAASALTSFTFTGSSVQDVVSASNFGDSISSGAGNDLITVGGALNGNGNDTVNSGTGDDTITLGATYALNGYDVITTGTGSDTIDASAISTAGIGALTGTRTYFNVTDFTAGSGNDLIKFGVATFTSYGTGLTTTLVSKAAAALASAAAFDSNSGTPTTNYVIYDTAANILLTSAATKFDGAALAIASDTGNVYYDLDGDFTSSSVIIGKLVITGTLDASNISIV